ncbi:MAG: peptidylprolyl isomerase [Thermoanaerobaculales bacterium]|nr:peptidylprolyl isomerase [Thermoanaerobaculales bacterium]
MPEATARRRRALAVAGLLGLALAVPTAAHDPSSVEARVEYLLRRMDAGVMPTPMLIAMLRDPYPETRVLALRAVAASADPGQAALLREYLRDPDLRVRYQVMIAAGRLGAAGRDLAVRGLGDAIPRVRQAAAWAAAAGGPDALPPLLAAIDRETDPGVRATALANLWRFDDPAWIGPAAAAAAAADPQLRRAAAYSLARSTSPEARPALRRLASDPEPAIRATAVNGLGRLVLSREDVELLGRALGDADRRVPTAACAALAAQPVPALPADAAAAVAALWRPTEPQLAVAAIRAAGARREIGDDAVLLEIAEQETPWLAAEAMAALVRRGGAGAEELARRWRTSGDLWRRRAVAAVAPALGATWERSAARDPEAAVRLAWLEPLDAGLIAGRLDELRRLVASDPDPAVRTVALNHLVEAGAAGGIDELVGLARRWSDDPLPDARAAALVAALTLAGDDEQRSGVLERAAADRDPAVGIMVVNAARGLGLPARSVEREPRHDSAWYTDLVGWLLEPRWLDVVTDRGTFRVRLETIEAPIAAREIFELAEAGFYDGLTFHRVVPSFVVQGGDPRGDGWGGSGAILPDEPAFTPFDAGRVGLATSGPNTGSSQLFVTLMPADHLVGHYTNLGEVVAGREVLTRLQVGDRIRRVETSSGVEPPPPTPVLLGELGWPELAALAGWDEERLAYLPEAGAVARLRGALGAYRIVAVLGSWCSDSQREVPRLVRVLEEVDSDAFDLLLIGVDRTRRVDDPVLAAAAGVERTVDKVPTIVVLDAEGHELGRIVETAERPIEQLLVELIAPAEGWD